MKNIIYILATILLFSSCEDPISVEVNSGELQLSVDAFINSLDKSQTIKLLSTKQFFDEVTQEPFKADSVYVTDDIGNKYIFSDDIGNGEYIWEDSVLVHEGRSYELTIKAGDVIYSAQENTYPVPIIDSLNWEYAPATIGTGGVGGYLVELVARDLPGQTDYYWIRFKKNGVYDLRKEALNLSVDGSFSAESQGDGQLFIPPISTFPMFNDEDTLTIGDQATYEIWSISERTNGFWAEVLNQAIQGGGIGALFATPIANVKTNITSSSKTTSNQAVGWFSVSLVSDKTITIYKKEGESLSFSTL